jgi:hypothetical protein
VFGNEEKHLETSEHSIIVYDFNDSMQHSSSLLSEEFQIYNTTLDFCSQDYIRRRSQCIHKRFFRSSDRLLEFQSADHACILPRAVHRGGLAVSSLILALMYTALAIARASCFLLFCILHTHSLRQAEKGGLLWQNI